METHIFANVFFAMTAIAQAGSGAARFASIAGGGERVVPLIPFVVQDFLLMAGLMASFSLFLGVKKENRTQARRHQHALREIEELLPKLRAAAMSVPEGSRDERVSVALQGPLVRSGFNIQRRTQALRLLRRGHDVAHISAALGVPRGEVELLIRVQQIAATRPLKLT